MVGTGLSVAEMRRPSLLQYAVNFFIGCLSMRAVSAAWHAQIQPLFFSQERIGIVVAIGALPAIAAIAAITRRWEAGLRASYDQRSPWLGCHGASSSTSAADAALALAKPW